MTSRATDHAERAFLPGDPGVTRISDQPFRRQRIRPLEPAWAAAEKARATAILALRACHTLLLDARERRSGPQARVGQITQGEAPPAGRSLALYAHFTPHGGVSEMVLWQLREYARLGFRIIFISAAPSIDRSAWEEVRRVTELVLHRRNYGLDFGAWSDTLNTVGHSAEPWDELLLVNDSVLGPIHPLDMTIERMRAAGEGLFGMTESVQHAPHLQSYFLLARGVAATADTISFLRTVRLSASKHRLIQSCEIGLSRHMRALGHQVAALWSYAEMERAIVASEAETAALEAMLPGLAKQPLPAGPARPLAMRRALLDFPLNPVHHFAGLLLRQFAFPFLKTELVLRNPARSPEAVDWRELIPSGSPVPPRLIADHLLLQQQPLRRREPSLVLLGNGDMAGSSSAPDAPAGSAAWRRRLEAAWARRHAPEADPAPVTMAPSATLLKRAARGGLVLAFSHDDYADNCGGVQNVIGAEQRSFAAEGMGYLHLAPARPREGLVDPADDAHFLVRLDGVALGVARLPDLLAALGQLGQQGVVTAGIVHHLAGHAPEHVLALLQAADIRQPLFWLHDFGTLCQSSALLRNDIAFCGAPPASSAACMVCVHGAARAQHLARMRDFFSAARPTVLAPSHFALDFWKRHGDYAHAEVAVVPPARLVATPIRLGMRKPDRRLRVAHLGTRDFHKGWQVFMALAQRFADDPRYEFLQLGLPNGAPLPQQLRSIPVRVQPDRREAMADAVADQQIDIVVNWSLCQETFSFTVHEALAGGAFVVARAEAGNVWPAITANAPDRGIAVEDETQLETLFAGDRLQELLGASPPIRRLLLTSGASAEWLLARRSEGLPSRMKQHV